MSLFLLCTEEPHRAVRSRFFLLPFPVKYIPVPQAPPTHQAQVYSWKLALMSTLLGLLGFSRFLHGSLSLFITHSVVDAWERHLVTNASNVVLACTITLLIFLVSALSLSSYKSIYFLCLLFNCLFLPFSLGFKLHENRDFVYFATSPAPGIMVGT